MPRPVLKCFSARRGMLASCFGTPAAAADLQACSAGMHELFPDRPHPPKRFQGATFASVKGYAGFNRPRTGEAAPRFALACLTMPIMTLCRLRRAKEHACIAMHAV